MRANTSPCAFFCAALLMMAAAGCGSSHNPAGTYRVSGTLTWASTAAVKLTGAKTESTTTDASGNYSFSGLSNGSYAVTPLLAGSNFTPWSRSVIVDGADVPGLDFTADSATNTYTISGTVSATSTVTVALTGETTESTTTDASGSYSFKGLSNGSYTVTPSLAGRTFTPSSRSVIVNGADMPNQSYYADDTPWVGTWATGPQLTEDSNNPPVSLSNSTLRQVARVSIGGSRLRLKLTNAYGSGPVELLEVHLARTAGAKPESAIVPGTDKVLTFGGSGSVTIAAGAAATSDPLDFAVPEATNLTISIAFGATPTGITGHPGSRTTSYIVSGNATASQTLTSPATTAHWYYIQAIDVMAPAPSRAVAILGDSITDGRGSTTDGNNRWPDALALRLLANDSTKDVAVLNLGIGGNTVLSGGLGPTAKARFDSDILGQSGVKYVVILEGVNDLGYAPSQQVATDLIAAYQTLIGKAHQNGLKVYGSPIMPIKGSGYYTDDHETARRTVNTWIRTSGSFDAVVDLDAAVRDPAEIDTLFPAYDSGDHLHLSVAGLQATADAIDLSLFAQ